MNTKCIFLTLLNVIVICINGEDPFECCSNIIMKDSGYFASLYYSKMNTTHNGKPKWCSTTPFKTCLEFTPGTTTTTDDQDVTPEADQWAIYWNDDIHTHDKTVFTAEAGDAKCPNEIEPNKWKFSLYWGRFIESIECDPATINNTTTSTTISTDSTTTTTSTTTIPTTTTNKPSNQGTVPATNNPV